MTVFRIDASTRRVGDGRVVIGGSPLRLFRLTDAGARLFDRFERGEDVTANVLVDKLLDAGVIHPRPTPWKTPELVSVVIPAYNPSMEVMQRLVVQCGDVALLVIIDDCSSTPIPPISGAIVIRQPTNQGPAAARMTGLDEITTPFVVFVDTDVQLDDGWLPALCAHFADERVAAVGPRMASLAGPSLLQRYEATNSPLDLGGLAARVLAGSRVSYLPAAVLACHVSALREVGGFDPTLRFGEDVDLVWRLTAAGFRVRYEPSVVAHHFPRPSWRLALKQRYDYGTSAAPLEQRHPGSLAPVRINRWSFISWTIGAAGWPVIGTAIAGLTTAMLMRKLRSIPDGPKEALRLAGLGHLYAGRSIAAALTRAWWPITAVAMLLSKRARCVAALAAMVPGVLDWRSKRPDVHPVAYSALRLADDVAYGTGVLVGCVRQRSFACIKPELTTQ